MRDRLIELISEVHKKEFNREFMFIAEHIADYLLENGVVVPPCKVGDILYETKPDFSGRLKQPLSLKVVGFEMINNMVFIEVEYETITSAGWYSVNVERLGKTVFLTREEAEKALKGGAEE